MKPSFATLKSFHHSSDPGRAGYMHGHDLYRSIGYDPDTFLTENPAYNNTCAVRMSIALLNAGVRFDGRMLIKDGPLKGRRIEPGAKLLGDQLMRRDVFGRPSLYTRDNAPAQLSGKQGVVLFWRIRDYNGGHIDMIEGANTQQVCNSGCYFDCEEIWFWPLA